MKKITNKEFFTRDTISIAKDLVGKFIITTIDGVERVGQISEVECYLGINDSACHTYKGKRTPRTEQMWRDGGTIYIYLCYGLHNLFNIVTCQNEVPEAVLIRGLVGNVGPARTTKFLNIDKSFNGESIVNNPRISIFDDGKRYKYKCMPRVGIDFALQKDRDALLRFVLVQD